MNKFGNVDFYINLSDADVECTQCSIMGCICKDAIYCIQGIIQYSIIVSTKKKITVMNWFLLIVKVADENSTDIM